MPPRSGRRVFRGGRQGPRRDVRGIHARATYAPSARRAGAESRTTGADPQLASLAHASAPTFAPSAETEAPAAAVRRDLSVILPVKFGSEGQDRFRCEADQFRRRFGAAPEGYSAGVAVLSPLDPDPMAAADTTTPTIEMRTADPAAAHMPAMVAVTAVTMVPMGGSARLGELGRCHVEASGREGVCCAAFGQCAATACRRLHSRRCDHFRTRNSNA